MRRGRFVTTLSGGSTGKSRERGGLVGTGVWTVEAGGVFGARGAAPNRECVTVPSSRSSASGGAGERFTTAARLPLSWSARTDQRRGAEIPPPRRRLRSSLFCGLLRRGASSISFGLGVACRIFISSSSPRSDRRSGRRALSVGLAAAHQTASRLLGQSASAAYAGGALTARGASVSIAVHPRCQRGACCGGNTSCPKRTNTLTGGRAADTGTTGAVCNGRRGRADRRLLSGRRSGCGRACRSSVAVGGWRLRGIHQHQPHDSAAAR